MDIRNRYCQSCGMPVDINKKEFLGTNKDHSKNEEFCFSCLIEGEFSFDHSMEQLIDDWVKETDWYNEYSNTHYTPSEFRSILKKRLPTLSRWKQKKETKNVNYEIINRIAVYINKNLFGELNLELLAEMAGLSKFHFIRTFKSVISETPGNYIQRLRLEHIAHLLITTGLSLNKILDLVNYQSRQSLTKAFKKHFGIPPGIYKERLTKICEECTDESATPEFEVRRIKNINILYIALDESCRYIKNYRHKWSSLLSFAEDNNLITYKSKFISMSLDDPLIRGIYSCRFYLGITIDDDIKPRGKFGIMKIPDGKYAVFPFKGNYESLRELYRSIYLSFLSQSEYRQKNTMSFEMYINTPLNTPMTDLLTEVYIPIEKKTKTNEIL